MRRAALALLVMAATIAAPAVALGPGSSGNGTEAPAGTYALNGSLSGQGASIIHPCGGLERPELFCGPLLCVHNPALPLPAAGQLKVADDGAVALTLVVHAWCHAFLLECEGQFEGEAATGACNGGQGTFEFAFDRQLTPPPVVLYGWYELDLSIRASDDTLPNVQTWFATRDGPEEGGLYAIRPGALTPP